jgi:hypothetical protein
LLLEFDLQARTPVNTPILVISIFNTLHELFVFLLSLTFSSFQPIIVAIFGHLQYGAEARQRKKQALFMNKRKLHGWGCAKMVGPH